MRSFSATKVDIWAAGVTLYYMVEGSVPFKGKSLARVDAHTHTHTLYLHCIGRVIVSGCWRQ